MPPTDASLPTDPDVAAAELALGLLEGDERAAALRRQLADPAFAREVQHWRERFASLFASIPERAPAPAVARRIETRLDRQDNGAISSPGLWRPLALASSLAAAMLAGLLAIRTEQAPPLAPQPHAELVAAMALTDGKAAPLAAYYDPAQRIVRMPGPMPIPAGRSAQLWAITTGRAPVPLGLFHVVGNTVVADARTTREIPAGTTLAISFEPIGGSPTGAPTGPVVASGSLSKV